jgi:GDP-4-dehydro-6-deoxy-D-mannose reductase
MRILITGITGFAGGHLAERLLGEGVAEIHGISRRSDWPGEWQHLETRVRLSSCDLADRKSVKALLLQSRPEQIYHLAGYAHAGRSVGEADAAWAGNLDATRNLYEAVAQSSQRARILFVGSGMVYGDSPRKDQPQIESAPLLPASPYAASKAAADLMSYQFTRGSGLDIVRVRPFNHIGPRQSPEYAIAHFAQQIAAIEQGRQPPVLETGNLEPERDLTDVRDMVAAYALLMRNGQTGAVYNAASGRVVSMREVLDHLLKHARVPIEVRQQAGLIRATEHSVACGDAMRLRQEIGWQPRFALEQTLDDTLEYWRSVITHQKRR